MKYLFIILFSVHALSSLGQVNLNEMQSSNSSTIADNMGEFDDWIEIHNPTTDPIEIGGLILKDQLDTWTIPSGDPSTLIPPGGYFLLWADDQEFQGIFHTNFKLASGGEFLGLYESDGITVIDSLTIPAMDANDSYLKCVDGWFQTSIPNPLTDNNCTVSLTENTNFNDLFTITITNDKQLQVKILDDLKNQKSISIYSLDGKEIMKQPLDDKKTVLNLNMLKSNIYLVTISTPNFIYSKKIVL
ncbi:MAG: hypothetical protein ACI8ZM_003298 [Crocinitomix sp.]|jgi:hypothetical protein